MRTGDHGLWLRFIKIQIFIQGPLIIRRLLIAAKRPICHEDGFPQVNRLVHHQYAVVENYYRSTRTRCLAHTLWTATVTGDDSSRSAIHSLYTAK